MADDFASGETIDIAEAKKFAEYAEHWWNPKGKFGILHKFNPVRIEYIRNKIAEHFVRHTEKDSPFEGLSILDVGCGGGLVCEALAALGAKVTGIDVSGRNIKVAKNHAKISELDIDYQLISIEELALKLKKFDVILNMEVVEHVADIDIFLSCCCKVLRPGGLMFCATLNRSLRSFLFAIIGAEYILHLLPQGTHRWDKFVTPGELQNILERFDLRYFSSTGIGYNPLTRRFFMQSDMSVNYILVMAHPLSA